MWLVYALLSGLLYTASGLITRHVLRGNKDAWAFSFYFSAIGALVSLPFFVSNPKIATTFPAWGLLSLVGILIVGQNLLNFKATNTLEASVQGALTKFRLVWVFILSMVILHEGFSLYKLIGTVLTVVAGIIIIQKFKKPESLKGVIYVLAATTLYATVIILYKYLFVSFNSVSLTFFIFFIPAVINMLIMPRAMERIGTIMKMNRWGIVAACGLGGFANLAMNQSLAIGEASRALVIIEAFLVTTLIGERIFLKEKSNLLIKIIAVLLATAGAMFIRL